MPSSYPASIPDILNAGSADFLDKNPLADADWRKLLEHAAAIMAALGINPQGSKADVAARVLAAETMIALFGTTGRKNLQIRNDATTPNSKLVITADVLAVEGLVVGTVNVTLDLTVTGKNGSTYTLGANEWGHVWVGVKSSTLEVCAIFDDSSDRTLIDTSHGSLAGFSYWRRVAAWRRQGSVLLKGAKVNDRFLYHDAQEGSPLRVLTTGAATTDTDVSLATVVPPGARHALVQGHVQTSALFLRPKGGGADARVLRNTTGQAVSIPCELGTDAAQVIQYRVAAGGNAHVDVLGFTEGV